MKIIRNPNIDSLRILGMLAIIIHHLLLHGKAMSKYKRFKELRLLNLLCMWHVSSFGLISGITINKTHKFYNLLYLWILVVFYSFFFEIVINKLNNRPIIIEKFITDLFPVIHNKYWYFTSYFGMFPFLPFIKKSIMLLSLIEIKKIIYFMIGIFIIWVSYYKDPFSLNGGYSPISLLIFYIFGAYTGKYFFFKKITNRIIIGLICFILFLMVSLITYNINIKNCFPNMEQKLKNLFRPSIKSLPTVCQVFSITIFVSQIKFNNFLSRIITIIGPLTFDVYLIHENRCIRDNYIKKSFSEIPNNICYKYILFLVIKKAFIIFIISIFISYLRSIIFRILKVKDFCIICELMITKIFGYFN